MSQSAIVEPLDRRDHFAATPALDPTYAVNYAAFADRLGPKGHISQAVAGPNGRTYLLADRDERGTNASDKPCLLTVLAIGGDGNLDSTFGDRGIALTNWTTVLPRADAKIGILRVDNVGRLYFADATRVFRLHADGSPDRSFGKRGVLQFAGSDRTLELCDIVPTDTGVLIATTKTVKNVQRFYVQKAAKTVQMTFQIAHNGGYLANDFGGNLNPGVAQFARQGATTVLARVQRDDGGIVDAGTDDAYALEVSKLIVTRFDAAGHGTDVMLKRLDDSDADNGPVTLGNSTLYDSDVNALRLWRHGRSLDVLTTSERLVLDLKTRTGVRSDLPVRDTDFGYDYFAGHSLLSDGTVAEFADDLVYKSDTDRYNVNYVNRYAGAAPDPSFNGGRTLTITQFDYGDATPFNEQRGAAGRHLIQSMFLDSNGRLNFLERDWNTDELTLRRLT